MPRPDPPKLYAINSERPPSEGELSELAAAVKRMRDEQHLFFAFNREMSRIIRNEYEEYVAAGFSPAQAMQLVKAKLTPQGKG